jgi:hypothetical protein
MSNGSGSSSLKGSTGGGSLDASSLTSAIDCGDEDVQLLGISTSADGAIAPDLSDSESDAAAADATTPCPGGRTLCNSDCVDTSRDTHACGACGRDCLNGTCAAGQCQPIVVASGLSDAVGLAVDGTNAYFSAGAEVYACAVGGCGAAPTLLADYQDAIGAVTVDATTVYWTTSDSVLACDISGCNDMPMTLATDLANPWGIAVDETRVYWANYDDGTVAWLPLAGGEGATIQGGTSPQYVAVNSGTMYFTDVGDGTRGDIAMWAGTSAQPVVVANGPSPSGIAADAARVYWTAGTGASPGATVSAYSFGSLGSVPDVLATQSGTPQRIAVDATGVYWANSDVYVLRPGSQTPIALTSGQVATDIAVDDAYVYWIAVGTSADSVMRVAK